MLNKSNKNNVKQEILLESLTAKKEGYQSYVTHSEDDITDTDHDVTATNDEVGDTGAPKTGDRNRKPKTKQDLGVAVLVAIMQPATRNSSSTGSKPPLKSHPSYKIRVLLDTSSNGDLYYHEKESPNLFPILD
jgi:hypothetical protein